MTKLFHEPKHLALIAMMAVIAVAPMLFRGIPGGNDAIQHYEFAQQVVDSVRSGNLFPSFAGNSNHGFGDAGLRVYPPLSYYVLAGFYFVSNDWYLASIIAFFLIFFVGAIGVYFLADECFSTPCGLAAAAIYTFSPFHLNEIYNNFLYAEFAAGAVLPFCFLFLARALRTGKLVDAVLLGIAYAVLVITHLPLTLIGSVALFIYALARAQKTNYRAVLNLLGAAVLAIVLSSFYWVRMVSEMSWVKHSQPEYFSRIWSYKENYLFSLRTFTDFMNDGQSLWFGDLMLLAMLLLCVPSFIFVIRSGSRNQSLVAIAILFAFCVFMTTPLSGWIWDTAGFLQKAQFPWRWLSIVTLAGSVIAGAGLAHLSRILTETNSRIGLIAAAAALLPFVFLSAFVTRAPDFTPWAEFNARNSVLSDGETFEGWWPIWAKRQAFTDKDKVIASNRTVEIEEWGPTSRSIRIAEGAAQNISLSTYYYPHWRAMIDGNPVETFPDSLGRLSFQIPSNAVDIKLEFSEPRIIVIATFLSLLGWLVLIPILLWNYYSAPKTL